MQKESERRKIAQERVLRYEKQHRGQKYVFIDNKTNCTNVIFTGCGQSHYMMITWFRNDNQHNYLYLHHPVYDHITEEIIVLCGGTSRMYNFIGISFGAAAAIALSKKFNTIAVVSVDPQPLANFANWNLPQILAGNQAIFFLHHSITEGDLAHHASLIRCLEQTSILYLVKSSQSKIHSTHIPNEEMILTYLRFAQSLRDPTNQILMKIVPSLNSKFLQWT